MPYLHPDLRGTYPVKVERELATRLFKPYAKVMETHLWRPNVGITELGKHNRGGKWAADWTLAKAVCG